MAVLEVKNIETYYGPILAIKGISFEVEEGAIVTILGANGAGKTSVLKTISGVMEPEKGTIEFMGRRIDRMDPDKIVRMGISHVPEGREVFHDLTVRENLAMGAFLRRDREGIAKDLATVYGYFPVLKARRSQMGGNMSGGEQQMLAIATGPHGAAQACSCWMSRLWAWPRSLSRRSTRSSGASIGSRRRPFSWWSRTRGWPFQRPSTGTSWSSGRIVMADTCKELMENEDVREFYLGIKEESVRGSKRWKRKKRWR